VIFPKSKETTPTYTIPLSWHKQTNDTPTASSRQQTNTPVVTPPKPKTKTSTNKVTSFFPRINVTIEEGKLKLPFLRRAKRILAGMLLLINLTVGLASFGAVPPLAIFLFLNSFLLLDYLYKTKQRKLMR